MRSGTALGTVQALLSDSENIPVLPTLFFSTNPKPSHMLAAVKKINSIPAKTSTWVFEQKMSAKHPFYKLNPLFFEGHIVLEVELPWRLIMEAPAYTEKSSRLGAEGGWCFWSSVLHGLACLPRAMMRARMWVIALINWCDNLTGKRSRWCAVDGSSGYR